MLVSIITVISTILIVTAVIVHKINNDIRRTRSQTPETIMWLTRKEIGKRTHGLMGRVMFYILTLIFHKDLVTDHKLPLSVLREHILNENTDADTIRDT